jgi:hypothetical protein
MFLNNGDLKVIGKKKLGNCDLKVIGKTVFNTEFLTVANTLSGM